MNGTEQLLTATIGEIERMLNSKTVVGEPIALDGTTVIPLVNVGFGFGAGGGTGKGTGKEGEGSGGGAGGGGGVKPVAVLIADKQGVRMEMVKGATASFAEKVVEAANTAMQQRAEKKSKT